MSVGPGFVLVDKATGWTSHDVVAKARTLFRIRKIGHAGTLDPMATGLLVLGLGAATRLLRFITDQPKEYVATACFGVTTDTLDADGEVLDRTPMEVGAADVAEVMAGYVGEVLQVPPMFSAVRVGGKRLHDLARSGHKIERSPRSVRVDRIGLEGFEPGVYPLVRFRVVGGRGLYVRVLADDVAKALGGRAHLTALRRVRNGVLSVENATGIDRIVALCREDRLDRLVLTPNQGLAHLPPVEVPEDLVGAVSNGRRLPTELVGSARADEPVRMVAGMRMLAVYRIRGDRLSPEVVLP
ncbi:MAG: tRNA pseudouridine(55) synthase TruB [bacterium]|nr:tRNA pseudouridine(55) synthase TruB [bacterium]MDE0288999.1 tRNA pseudouridine(55) synthase TruB [bacterium]MDE0439923.1 tRNA pseudouridine(55) synthase TruB [bacterium]